MCARTPKMNHMSWFYGAPLVF